MRIYILVCLFLLLSFRHLREQDCGKNKYAAADFAHGERFAEEHPTGEQSLTVLTKQPWLWIPSGLMIVVLVIAINFIGDALRDALDPNSGK